MTEWMRGGVITLCLAAGLFLLAIAGGSDGLRTISYMAGIVGLAFVIAAVAKGGSATK